MNTLKVKLRTDYEKLIFLFVAVVVLLFTSQCSFLFAINNAVDANVMLQAGNLVLHGKIPYLEFFEHKGLIVFFVHALALLICPKSFYGVYIFEIIASYFFYVYSYKSIELLDKELSKGLRIALTAVSCSMVYFSVNMGSGDQVEEFALPFIAYFIYTLIKYFQKEEISRRTYLLLGVYIGLIFWSKYLVLLVPFLLFVGWATMLIIHKQYKELVDMCITIFIGFCIVTVPLLLYLLFTGSFNVMCKIYFYVNLVGYPRQKYTDTIVKFIGKFVVYNGFIMPIYLGGMFVIALKAKKDILLRIIIIVHGVSIILLTCCNAWQYYYLPTFAFVPIEMLYLMKLVKRRWQIVGLVGSSVLILCMYPLNMTYHTFNRCYCKQKEVAKIINETENPKILILNSADEGYYLASNIVPSDYYYSIMNVNTNNIIEHYIDIIRKQEVDYVITKHLGKENNTKIDWSIKTNYKQKDLLENNNYKIVYTCDDVGRDMYTNKKTMVVVYKLQD